MSIDTLKSLADLGFSVSAVIASGVFIVILLKYILAGVVDDVESLNGLANMLNNRIRTMNNDLISIDALVSVRHANDCGGRNGVLYLLCLEICDGEH